MTISNQLCKDIDLQLIQSIVQQHPGSNRTALHIVASNGDLDCTLFLLYNGVNINAQDNRGDTPLHMACDFNRIKIVQTLLQFGADFDIQNNNGITPLNLATNHNYIDILDIFTIYKNHQELSNIVNKKPSFNNNSIVKNKMKL